MAVMTMEVVAVAGAEVEWIGDVPCDEGCVWCEVAQEVAHTVDGFCEFCGATGHACP